ncbi:unnamed protein product [Durusdinium trenchii]|uniref:Uncharacterized protein n=1 Tax=Durusdinium trenchii TaxID=1381693 RepID=A0ABP0N111_9DINO
MVRKSNAPRGPTKRQKERRTVKEQKARQKNEARFASAVRGSQASLLEQDFQFVTDTLQDNPRWIQPLAGLIRSGALNGILKDNFDEENASSVGPKWKGRAKTWLQLPLEMKVAMIEATGLSLQPDLRTDDFVKRAFQLQFWVGAGPKIPLKRTDIRQVSTLERFAKLRVESLGVNYLNLLNSKEPLKANMDLHIWSVTGNTLCCCALAKTEEDGLEYELLPLAKGDRWILSDRASPSCRVRSELKPNLYDFLCWDFFSDESSRELPDYESTWDEPDNEAAEDILSTSALTETGGAPTVVQTPVKPAGALKGSPSTASPQS